MVGELNENEIQDFLKINSIGRIGCTDGETVYIVPINYHYDENSVICYSIEGLKIEMMRKHPSVCFEVDDIKNSNNWKSVIVNGFFEEITDKAELDQLRPHYTEYLVRKRASVNIPEDKSLSDSPQIFYRIRFQKTSGRYQNGFIASEHEYIAGNLTSGLII